MKVLSSKTHTIIGLVVGVALIAAPWIFQFDEVEPAKWVAIVIGAFSILSELTSTSPSSPLKLVPMRIHLAMDVVAGIVLALSPWIFGFADEDANAWVPHLIVGILLIGYALMTRTDDAVVRGSSTTRPNRPGTV